MRSRGISFFLRPHSSYLSGMQRVIGIVLRASREKKKQNNNATPLPTALLENVTH